MRRVMLVDFICVFHKSEYIIVECGSLLLKIASKLADSKTYMECGSLLPKNASKLADSKKEKYGLKT